MNEFDQLLSQIDAQRAARGFIPVMEMLEALTSRGNILLDPFSILVSRGVELGSGNLLYPNVIIETSATGRIQIGNGNIFFPTTRLLAEQGVITIGDENEFGDGGARVKANTRQALIEIGSHGRYMNGTEIMGQCRLGSGSQIIGAISVQNCNLEAGYSYRESDADQRGGLLKGFGVARNLTVGRGQVINGSGSFAQADIELQSAYHPKNV